MQRLIIAIFLLASLALSGCTQQSSAGPGAAGDNQAESQSSSPQTSNDLPMSSTESVADELKVYYFHSSARCYSCKTLEQYAREALDEKYSQEMESGLIDFRSINIDKAANKDIARKYQASGSSLFFNPIRDGRDNIEQDTTVWRLLGDEAKFNQYIEGRVNYYLGL